MERGNIACELHKYYAEAFSCIWSQTGLVSDKNHRNIVGPFSGLEFETVSAVPRGPIAGREGKPRGFETITQLLQLDFIIVAIGNWGVGAGDHS